MQGAQVVPDGVELLAGRRGLRGELSPDGRDVGSELLADRAQHRVARALQPVVKDLTGEIQRTLQIAFDEAEKLMNRLRRNPDVAYVEIDRDSAGRLGITPAMIGR